MPQVSRNRRVRYPAFRVSRTDPSRGAGCGGSPGPGICSPARLTRNASDSCFTGCSIAFRRTWGSRRTRASTSTSIRSKGASGCSLNGGRSAGRSSPAAVIGPRQSPDALAFRRERRRLFPGAADNERRDEIAEGLPSYTEVAAWANSPADAHRAAAPPASIDVSIVGAFPYTSGRAYGVLLDDLLPGWRGQVRATSDLGDMLTAANNRPLTANLFRGSGAL